MTRFIPIFLVGLTSQFASAALKVPNIFNDHMVLQRDKPVGAEAIIIRALDNVIEHAGLGPYNLERPDIVYRHTIFGLQDFLGELWRSPGSNRSTWA